MANLYDFGKETYFENNGYTWDEKIESYVNKSEWKIFTKNYIDDHSFDILLTDFQKESTPGKWMIFINTESPTDIHNIHKHYGAHA